MLVLTRKLNEELILKLPDGQLIVISIEEIRGDKVRIGTKADPDIEIYRKELFDRIKERSNGT